ncbi:hypothetical protein TruAng_001515 [Truncatella angustata]|nr:hypothetical protein TruAng_001515 [Truncatella angustata]
MPALPPHHHDAHLPDNRQDVERAQDHEVRKLMHGRIRRALPREAALQPQPQHPDDLQRRDRRPRDPEGGAGGPVAPYPPEPAVRRLEHDGRQEARVGERDEPDAQARLGELHDLDRLHEDQHGDDEVVRGDQQDALPLGAPGRGERGVRQSLRAAAALGREEEENRQADEVEPRRHRHEHCVEEALCWERAA